MSTAKRSAKKGPVKKPAARKTAVKKTAVKKAAVKKAAAKKAVAPRAAKAPATRIPAVPAPEVEIPTPTTTTNYIALVLDRSGSMSNIKGKVIASCNEQLESIRSNAAATGQPSYASLYTFESKVDPPRFFGRPADKLVDLVNKDFRLGGSTALLDGVGTAIEHMKTLPGADSEHASFLVVTITDGHENASRTYKKDFGKRIADAQATGRWSFAFLCPKSGVSVLRRYGVPEGNILPWQPNQKGAAALGKQVAQGLQQFYEQRSTGQRATTKFFVTNVAAVDKATLATKLGDISDQFARMPVKTAASIREFVEGQLKRDKALSARFGTSYQKGHAFYELTKPETVQASKSVVILDRDSDKLYGGDEARELLGLPTGESCKVKPGDHGSYAIFVESTSLNRKLEARTTLLYRA